MPGMQMRTHTIDKPVCLKEDRYATPIPRQRVDEPSRQAGEDDEKGRNTLTTVSNTTGAIAQPTPLALENAQDVYRRASQLGIVAGLRSMTPLALLAWSEENTPSAIKTVTTILATGELVGDKLPTTPSRLKPGPLIGRLVIGAIAGALLARRAHLSPAQGAVRGAIGALIGSVAGAIYRFFVPQATGLPDAVWALVEDGAAFTIGANAVGGSPMQTLKTIVQSTKQATSKQ